MYVCVYMCIWHVWQSLYAAWFACVMTDKLLHMLHTCTHDPLQPGFYLSSHMQTMLHITGETSKDVLRGKKCPLKVCESVLYTHMCAYVYDSCSFAPCPFPFPIICGFSTSFTYSHCPLFWLLFLVSVSSPFLKWSQLAQH